MIDPALLIAAWTTLVDQVEEIDDKLQLVQPQLVLDELLELRGRLDHLLQLLRT
jgi:hypothetical protein